MARGSDMRKVVITTLFSILFFAGLLAAVNTSQMQTESVPPTAPSVASADPLLDVNITSISRSITFTTYLLNEFSDTYTVLNNGTASLTKFVVCTESYFDSNLLFISAGGAAGESYPLTKRSLLLNGFNAYDVELLEPLAPGESQDVVITMIYANLTSTSGTYSTQSCYFQFNLFPLCPYLIDQFTCTLALPSTATLDSFSPEPSSSTDTSGTWSTTLVESFSAFQLTASFTYNDAPILQMNSLARRITIDPWGYISVEEDHVLFNTGLLPIESYTYRIPANASNFQMKDDLGGIQGASVSETMNTDGKTKDVTINLNVNRARLLGGNQFKYTTSYQLIVAMYLSSSWNNYYLNLQTFTSQMDFLIVSETTQIILLTGQSIQSITPNPSSMVVEETRLVATYSRSMISPLHNQIVGITFQVNGFWMMVRPIMMILLILAVSSGYVFIRKIVRKKQVATFVERTKIPTRELQEFISLYEEKAAFLRELDVLNEDLKNKKIAKKIYRKRVDDINAKLKEQEEDLKPLRKVIAEADDRFWKIIDKFQFYEAERISIEDSLMALDARYRRGAIPSRNAFLKLSSDFTKRLEKIQDEIDKLLSELKSYIY